MKYPKIVNVGDPSLTDLFKGPVVVEEKIDGSQFRVWFDAGGKIHFGSKAVDYDDEHPPDRMFVPAITEAERQFLDLDKPIRDLIEKKFRQLERDDLKSRHLRRGSPFFVAEVGQYRIAFESREATNQKRVVFIGDHKTYEGWCQQPD